MRIAISGTHFIGKSTLIEDFIKRHPEYRAEREPYYQLQDESASELTLDPNFESFIEQLDYSINQLKDCGSEQNIIFDRCPVDFLAYALCALDQESMDINDSELCEKLAEIREALGKLDIIVFLPISSENSIEYMEDNPAYRKAADRYFKKLYREDICDIFPSYDHPRIIEISGNRSARIRKLEYCLIN